MFLCLRLCLPCKNRTAKYAILRNGPRTGGQKFRVFFGKGWPFCFKKYWRLIKVCMLNGPWPWCAPQKIWLRRRWRKSSFARGVRPTAADPLYRRDLRLAGHRWERNGRNVLRVSCVDALSKIYFFLSSHQWPTSGLQVPRRRGRKSRLAKWGTTGRRRPPLSEGSATRRPPVGAKTVETCSESHVWMLCRRFTFFLSSHQWPTSGLQVPRRRWRKSSLAKWGTTGRRRPPLSEGSATRRPLVGAFRCSSGVCPSHAGFSFFRDMVLHKWGGCLAGHRGEFFQTNFGNEGEFMNTT